MRTKVEEASEASVLDVVTLFRTVFRNDVRFKILTCLANREGANLREIARNVSLSHKNLAKYLKKLMQEGVVEAFPVGLRSRVYRLNAKYDFLREFL